MVRIILLLGALFVATRLVRLARLWSDIRRNRAEEKAAELAFLATQQRGIPELGRTISEDDLGDESSDLGVALALALREAEAQATGHEDRLDAP